MKPPEETSAERQSRRERLAVHCALDRAALRLALRARPARPDSVAGGGALGGALSIAAFLPGPVGRWSRRIALGLRLFKGLGVGGR